MFSLSPIPPSTGDARVAAPSTRPADWCGTPLPQGPQGRPHPLYEARTNIGVARTELSNASRTLTPVMPMWVDVDDTRYIDHAAAVRHATAGIAAIDEALAYKGSMSAEILGAVDSASRSARLGLAMLTSAEQLDVPLTVARFDAATNWLSIADSLIGLELGDVRPLPIAS